MLKKKKLQILLSLVITVILSTCYIPFNVFAEDDSEIIVDTEETEVEIIVLPLLRGTYLSNGTLILTDKGSGTVHVYGATICNRLSDATVTVYLQQFTGSAWVNYRSWSGTLASTDIVSVSNTQTVPKGYYYRLSGTFKATYGSTTETLSGTTASLYIN